MVPFAEVWRLWRWLSVIYMTQRGDYAEYVLGKCWATRVLTSP